MVAHAEPGWKDGWFVVPYQVIFRDVDAYGHVNNAVYFTYFETSRVLLWFEITGRSGPRDIDFIVARVECDFRLQLGMERVEIRTRVGEMRGSSFDFEHEIWAADGERLAANGKTVVVLFDWEKQAKRAIGDDLRRKVQSLQASEA
jgi:acyl-CoA thioester hydrolase